MNLQHKLIKRLVLGAFAILLIFGLTACGEPQATPIISGVAVADSPVPPIINVITTSVPTQLISVTTATPLNTIRAAVTTAASAISSMLVKNSTPTLVIAPTFTAETRRGTPAVPSNTPAFTARSITPLVLTGTEKLDAEEQSFVQQFNEYRRLNGVGALTLDSSLIQSAHWLAQDMAVHNTISHTDSLGRDIFKRIKAFGYAGRWVGENIAGGFEQASDNLKIWQSDDIHKNNLLGANYTKLGVGRYYLKGSFNRWYWVLDLG